MTMKFIYGLLFLCLSNFAFSQDIPSFSLEQLEERMYNDKDITYVVNFWATWCAPCVKELPYFEALNKKHSDNNVEVILVSMDFAKMKESRLIPFVKKKKIKSEVIHFTEKNPNYWIPKISDKWTGSIPATLILNGKQGVNEFFETTFDSLEELEELLDKYID